GWALADEELAAGVRPVWDDRSATRATMNVTVHAAETSVETLLEEHLPLLQRVAGEVERGLIDGGRPDLSSRPLAHRADLRTRRRFRCHGHPDRG
ncbi:MAG: hypothetical protein ABR500_12200, partial [Dermatophilaceae bacterium]